MIDIDFISQYHTQRSLIMKDKNWGVAGDNLPSMHDFILTMSYLPTSSNGKRIERRQIHDLGPNFTEISSKINRGDCLVRHGNSKNYIEIKNSIMTPSSDNPSLRLLQIRLYQNVDYYLCVAHDIMDLNDYKPYYFLLTHDQMVEECKIMKAGTAHGTIESNKLNTNKELSLTISFERYKSTNLERPELIRWKEKYLLEGGLESVKSFFEERSNTSKKEENDKFYTKPEIAQRCIDKLDMGKYDLVIEPSAGNGSFYNLIENKNKIGLDTVPEHKEIKKQDWFNYEIDPTFKSVLVVGNPPFGTSNSLSKKFIAHAASFDNVDTIAFILPNAYNKHTLQKHIPDVFKLTYIDRLPVNSFSLNGEDFGKLSCSFFIFEKNSDKECLRFNPDLYIDTDDWEFSTEEDYSFFVMGAALNTTKEKPTKNNRGYYIKVKDNLKVEDIENNFKKATWVGNGSAGGGVAWFTKPEIVKIYREQFNSLQNTNN